MESAETNHDRGRFEGEVLARLDSIDHRLSDAFAWMDSQEKRLRQVEQESVRVKAWGASLGFVAGIVASFLTKLVKW